MDRKGIFAYLIITFGLTWLIEIPPLLAGVKLVGLTSSAATYIFLPIMFMPALGALVTTRFITREGWGGLGLHAGRQALARSWRRYVATGLLIPALFALVYALTWALGFGQPDWGLDYFKGLYTSSGAVPPAMPDTRLVLLGVFLASLTVGTLFNWLFCVGEEIGWRGYLLPKLMPLGKPRAYLLLGVIWSVWHWPLLWMGFAYGQPGSPLALLAFTALTTGLGVYLNELRLKHDSALLAGWVHGVFNTQKLGAWFLLFPQVSPFLGGYAGLVGLVVWLALGLWETRRAKRLGGESGTAKNTKGESGTAKNAESAEKRFAAR